MAALLTDAVKPNDSRTSDGNTLFQLSSVLQEYTDFLKGKKVKADIALHGNPISELRNVGSHSVTCHPTQVNVPHLTLAMEAGTQFTYPGGMEG